MMSEDKALEYVNAYLNKKPVIKKEHKFLQKVIGVFTIAAKAYLRYAEIRGRF